MRTSCLYLRRAAPEQKVIQYMHYKVQYANSTQRIPEFPIAPEVALELLMAANFLDC